MLQASDRKDPVAYSGGQVKTTHGGALGGLLRHCRWPSHKSLVPMGSMSTPANAAQLLPTAHQSPELLIPGGSAQGEGTGARVWTCLDRIGAWPGGFPQPPPPPAPPHLISRVWGGICQVSKCILGVESRRLVPERAIFLVWHCYICLFSRTSRVG